MLEQWAHCGEEQETPNQQQHVIGTCLRMRRWWAETVAGQRDNKYDGFRFANHRYQHRPTWGPFWDHTLCTMANDLHVYEHLARAHVGHKTPLTSGNAFPLFTDGQASRGFKLPHCHQGVFGLVISLSRWWQHR